MGRRIGNPFAPPTYGVFTTAVSMTIATATVAIEKKMPRSRRVSAPTARPSSPDIVAPATICTRMGASNALNSATAVYAPTAKNAPEPKFT